MQKWEYKVLERVSEMELNLFGSQGWELVAIVPEFQTAEGRWTAYLKRPKP